MASSNRFPYLVVNDLSSGAGYWVRCKNCSTLKSPPPPPPQPSILTLKEKFNKDNTFEFYSSSIAELHLVPGIVSFVAGRPFLRTIESVVDKLKGLRICIMDLYMVQRVVTKSTAMHSKK